MVVIRMASNQIQDLLQCTGCHEKLNLDSKTLPCLHSFCCLCLENKFEGRTNGIEQCPECHVSLALGQLSLSPILSKTLMRQQFEISNWKCNLCFEDGIESVGSDFCNICQKIFCIGCSRFHKKFHPEHNAKNLDGLDKNDVIEAMVMDICSLHHEEKDSYCERCNICVCDRCYQDHSAYFPGCSSQPLSTKEEASGLKSQGPSLAKEMDDFRKDLRNQNDTMRDYTEKLNSECNLKCNQLWENYDEIMQYAKLKTNELCEEVRQSTAKQVERWRLELEENENIFKQLEIWYQNLTNLLNDSQQNGDVVCGLKLLKVMLSSRLHKSVEVVEKPLLEVTFPDWWLKIMEEIQSKKNVSEALVLEKLNVNNLISETEWNFYGSDLNIHSIYINTEDNHIFIIDKENHSIMEYTQWGILVSECRLFDKYRPFRMCSVFADIFVIACGDENRLMFLERNKVSPFLKIKNIVKTDKRYYSLFERNGTIFACSNDKDRFIIDRLTKEGEVIETIETQLSGSNCFPIIHADPSTGNFWGTNITPSDIFCYNLNGEEICSVKTEKILTDFCVDELGHLYFCTREGVFSFPPEKPLYTFEDMSDSDPRIFIVKDRIFLYAKIAGKYLIKIFKSFSDKE